jgi:hypothetical protein
MYRKPLSVLACLVLVNVGLAQDKAKDAIQKVEAAFEPADAKPGQTVTLKLTVRLADGYHTYPVTQPAPEAKFSANSITFPKDAPVVFVGETVDPVDPKTKKIEDYDLLVYPGGGTWIRKAVVPPTAKAGATTAKVKFKLLVCDENNCFPPKTLELEANLKVLEGPAVEVESKYKEEVEKAGKK